MDCHYSNSRVPCGSCAAYDIKPSECYQTHPMCLSITITTNTANTHTQRPTRFKGTPSRFHGTKVKMAGSEPLSQEADPHITKARLELGCRIKMVPIKK